MLFCDSSSNRKIAFCAFCGSEPNRKIAVQALWLSMGKRNSDNEHNSHQLHY
jgi:hypothetical protein